MRLFRGRRCDICRPTRYRRRGGVFELLIVTLAGD